MRSVLVLVFNGDPEPSIERIAQLVGEDEKELEINFQPATQDNWEKVFHQNVLSYHWMVVTSGAPPEARRKAHYVDWKSHLAY